LKSLLRSTFVVGPGDKPELLHRNYMDLVSSGLGFDTPVDNALWSFVQRFVTAHNHVPDYTTLTTHFKHAREDTVLDRLEELRTLPVRNQGDFKIRLETKAEERRIRIVSELLKEAAVITSTGLEVPDGKEKKILKGAASAVRFVLDRSHDILTPTLGTRLSGEVTSDGDDFMAEYDRVEADPLAGVGQFTGLEQMDTALSGARRHELWIHAAFTGGLKSTFLLNWAYNQSVYFKHDSLIFSLEMPYEQCRRILYSIHSSHEKFRKIRHKLGLQSDPTATVGVPYDHIKHGTLNDWHPNAKKFLRDYVVPDFNDHKNNEYGKIHIEVADPDKSDFTVADLRQRAELIYSENPFSMIGVDHVSLMAPRKWVSSTTDRLNEVVRDLKRLSMSFRRGQGIAVIALFQIGRRGYQEAQKKREKTGVATYDLTHLSYANEAERSADIVTASWVDDEYEKQNRVQFQCLKSRDSKKFEVFLARVEWPCRRLIQCYDVPQVQAPQGRGGGGAGGNNQKAIDDAADELLNDA
jgi:replicative DNA helicase